MVLTIVVPLALALRGTCFSSSAIGLRWFVLTLTGLDLGILIYDNVMLHARGVLHARGNWILSLSLFVGLRTWALFDDVYWVFVGDSDSPRSVVGVSPMRARSRPDDDRGIVGDKNSDGPSGVVGVSAVRARSRVDPCADRHVWTSGRKDGSGGREETKGEEGGEARS